MPNQRAPKQKQTSVVFPESLIADLDVIAKAEDRSRNYIINKFLLDQVKKIKSHQVEKVEAKQPYAFTKEPEKMHIPNKNNKEKVRQEVDKIEQKNKKEEPKKESNVNYKKAS